MEAKKNTASKIVGSIRLYLFSTILGKTEFEQYSVSGADSFYECGIITKKGNRSSGNLITEISSDLKDELALSSLELLGMAAEQVPTQASKEKLQKGQAEIIVTTTDGKSAKIVFSFNQLLQGSTETERTFATLVTKVRSAIADTDEALPECYNYHFHGL
jgi:hypothetical protein